MMVKITPAGWGAIVVAGAAAALLWSAHITDRSSVSWTDPQQPPAMLPLPFGDACGARMARPKRAMDYPSSLSAWAGSIVGDC